MEDLNANGVRVTLLATAGVVVESEGTRVMVDGLFKKDGHPFSAVPDELRKDLMAGRTPFGPVDCLMFTHLHPDHFDGQETIAYLESNPVKNVFLPACVSSEGCKRLIKWMDAHAVPYTPLELPSGGHARFSPGEGVEVTVFNTMHMGKRYGHVDNYCLLLGMNGRTLLITGDADYDSEAFARALRGREICAALVNPLFYQDRRGRAILDTVVRPGKAVLYHIPFAGDDAFMLRPVAKRLTERAGDAGYEVLALTEPGQQLFFL